MQRGAVVVEFALVAPVLFVLLFGMLEIGVLVIGTASGSNAAREGARVGILDYVGADDSTTTQFANVRTAARARLGGVVDDPAGVGVAVRCLDYDLVQSGSATPSKPCATTGANPVEVGRDLLEVTVTWRPVVTTGFISSGDRTDRVRMTIVGRPPTGSSGSGGGSLPLVTLLCLPTVAETDVNHAVTCTVTRTNTTTAVTVGYQTADGSATSPSDYLSATGSVSIPAGGSLTAAFDLTVVGDTSYETPVNETFTVSLISFSGAVAGLTTSATITIVDEDPVDSSPPSVLSTRVRDAVGAANGKLDMVEVTFDETLGSCSGTGLVLSGLPSGYAQSGSVQLSGSTAAFLVTGGAAYDTSVGSIQVSYNAANGALCDQAGNQVASFGATTPSDAAPPVLVGLTSTNGGGTLGKIETGDVLRFQFSEPVSGFTPSITVTLARSANSDPTLAVPGVLEGGPALIGSNHVDNNKAVTFAAAVSASGTDLVVTLTGACGGDCTKRNADTDIAASLPPSAGLRDAASNAPVAANLAIASPFALF